MLSLGKTGNRLCRFRPEGRVKKEDGLYFCANFEVFEVFTKIDDPIKRISADKKRHNFYSLLKLNEIDRGGLHFEVFRR